LLGHGLLRKRKVMTPKRVEILGVPVDCVTMDEALQWADEILAGDKAHGVIAVNPEKVMKARTDPMLLRQLRSASLLIPDGIGVVFAIRLLGLGQARRVPGSDLMPRLCERAARNGYKVFLFGAGSEVTARATASLRMQYPGIKIVGSRHGYVEETDMPEVVSDINASQADLLFIALGSPKQERWMSEHLPDLNVKICQGVGGTFDVIAGRVKRAPLMFRAAHLEWFFRLLMQPNRIFRQTALPRFAYHVLRQRVLG
jgi:N-acetylglucosaminyldiphosphoundecaprenol N-acetyl-beta-D-mannosaminyltransferase